MPWLRPATELIATFRSIWYVRIYISRAAFTGSEATLLYGIISRLIWNRRHDKRAPIRIRIQCKPMLYCNRSMISMEEELLAHDWYEWNKAKCICILYILRPRGFLIIQDMICLRTMCSFWVATWPTKSHGWPWLPIYSCSLSSRMLISVGRWDLF